MKKIILIILISFVTGFVYSQSNVDKDKIKQADKMLDNVEELIIQKYYHKAYNVIEEVEKKLPDYERLQKVYSNLKKEAPLKPVEDCDKLQEKINKGKLKEVSDEAWFFYSCPQCKKKTINIKR